MKCIRPITVKNAYGEYVEVPCGQCISCRLNHAHEWAIRITHEQLKYGDNCCFLTLTYNDEYLPKDLSVHKEHVQLFMKRFRRQLGQKKIRYFGCGEYGDTFGRPHYHIIVFGVSVDSKVFKCRHVHYEKGKPCGWHADLDSWSDPKTHEYYGKVHIGTVSMESANYVAKYVVKKVKGKGSDEYYKNLGIEPEFVLMSRRPGIGSDYVLSHRDYYDRNRFVTVKGIKYGLPRFYKDIVGKQRISLDSLRDRLRRKGIPENEIESRVRLSVCGFDPMSGTFDPDQMEKNILSKVSMRS